MVIPILPLDAIKRLREAAETDIPPNNPEARIEAIDRATAWVKEKYPKFFKKESVNESQA